MDMALSSPDIPQRPKEPRPRVSERRCAKAFSRQQASNTDSGECSVVKCFHLSGAVKVVQSFVFILPDGC